jgi:hypothetical protein
MVSFFCSICSQQNADATTLLADGCGSNPFFAHDCDNIITTPDCTDCWKFRKSKVFKMHECNHLYCEEEVDVSPLFLFLATGSKTKEQIYDLAPCGHAKCIPNGSESICRLRCSCSVAVINDLQNGLESGEYIEVSPERYAIQHPDLVHGYNSEFTPVKMAEGEDEEAMYRKNAQKRKLEVVSLARQVAFSDEEHLEVVAHEHAKVLDERMDSMKTPVTKPYTEEEVKAAVDVFERELQGEVDALKAKRRKCFREEVEEGELLKPTNLFKQFEAIAKEEGVENNWTITASGTIPSVSLSPLKGIKSEVEFEARLAELEAELKMKIDGIPSKPATCYVSFHGACDLIWKNNKWTCPGEMEADEDDDIVLTAAELQAVRAIAIKHMQLQTTDAAKMMDDIRSAIDALVPPAAPIESDTIEIMSPQQLNTFVVAVEKEGSKPAVDRDFRPIVNETMKAAGYDAIYPVEPPAAPLVGIETNPGPSKFLGVFTYKGTFGRYEDSGCIHVSNCKLTTDAFGHKAGETFKGVSFCYTTRNVYLWNTHDPTKSTDNEGITFLSSGSAKWIKQFVKVFPDEIQPLRCDLGSHWSDEDDDDSTSDHCNCAEMGSRYCDLHTNYIKKPSSKRKKLSSPSDSD